MSLKRIIFWSMALGRIGFKEKRNILSFITIQFKKNISIYMQAWTLSTTDFRECCQI